MAKKILILTGSPRRDGNSDALAVAFAEGAEKAGAEVHQINTSELVVNPCNACDKCWTNETPCIFEDDMKKVYPLLEWADMFVFAFPLYFYTFPAQLKVVMDKMYPYEFQKTEVTKNKDTVLLVCGGTDNQKDFEGVVSTYKICGEYMGWTDRGILCADSLNGIDDIQGTDWAEKAEKLGESLG